MKQRPKLLLAELLVVGMLQFFAQKYRMTVILSLQKSRNFLSNGEKNIIGYFGES